MSASLRRFWPKMSESLVFLSKSLFAHFFAKNERFARKNDERIPSPGFIFVLLVAIKVLAHTLKCFVLFPILTSDYLVQTYCS